MKRTKQLVFMYVSDKENAHAHIMSLTNYVSTRLVRRGSAMLKKQIEK
jgi:hypothetical protein